MADFGFEKRDFRKVFHTYFFNVMFSLVLIVCVLVTDTRFQLSWYFSFIQVVYCMDRALALASACHRFKILKAECLALLGRYPEAQSVARWEELTFYEE